ncbi:hypothetical protein OOZ63_06685 [Paucibacter sp. PLA-PC-4]|uniref:hypothetical protein n=1 Tax=Paucibacter sp. PLA-PC-4 TaxID=2993655 RepID=UPI002248F3FE|nr:hypothetical protein [Paucibacter sp. PLA-PC-4]MCX2861524.1 hypothetical protein [Paucibacter sp. PLA-PC-4]
MNRNERAASKALLCLAFGALVGCGGGGGSTPASPPPVPAVKPLVGRVIDGYVRGATVWLDLNGNRVRDTGEPSAVSQQAGAYQLELSAGDRACLPYATLYVDVPVDAVDEDSGPVSAAYQMAVAPRLQALSVDQLMNISPLTTAIWAQVEGRLSTTQPGLGSCQTLRQNQSLREGLSLEIRSVMQELVQRHNLSEQRIHADFIQTQDRAAYLIAQDIVKGLKAGFAHRQLLKARHPDASFLRAEVWYGQAGHHNTEGWLRSSQVWLPGDRYLQELVGLSEDLSQIRNVYHLREESISPWGQGRYTLRKWGTQHWDTTRAAAYCSFEEIVTVKTSQGVEYSLANTAAAVDAAEPSECLGRAPNGLEAPLARSYRVAFLDGHISRVSHDARFSLSPEATSSGPLAGWLNLKDKAATLDLAHLVEHLAPLDYRVEAPVVGEERFIYWHKRKTDDSAALRVQTDRYVGEWTRESTRADQTRLKECSRDGVNWVACS